MRSCTELNTNMCKVRSALRTLTQINKRSSLFGGEGESPKDPSKGPSGSPVVGRVPLSSGYLLTSLVPPGYHLVFTLSVSTSSALKNHLQDSLLTDTVFNLQKAH